MSHARASQSSSCFCFSLTKVLTFSKTVPLLPPTGKMTYVGQKFCMVVYPAETRSEGEEMKDVSSPLAKEDGETPKSADC